MKIPREVAEAAEYIKRFERTDTPEALETIDINATPTKKIHIDHENLNNSLVKFVSFVRMPKLAKEVMLYKLAHPGASNFQLAMIFGVRQMDIEMYEAEGVKRTQDALHSASLQDAINKFNSERSVESAVMNIKHDDNMGGESRLDG